MADRYTSLLQTAYTSFGNSAVTYPASGKDAQAVMSAAQKTKVGNLVSGAQSSLSTTLKSCGECISKATSGAYASKDAYEGDAQKDLRLLDSQIKALSDLFASFEREDTAWIKKGATLSWDSRKQAVDAQHKVNAQLLASIKDIRTHVDGDIQTAASQWGGSAPTPSPQPQPAPLPGGSDVDIEDQREALMDAALDGAPFVAVDPALKSAA